MAQVTVTIAGRTYRMACADGEEAHLEGLAAGFDGRISEMRASFGEIGDMRLHVMAALTLADELAETKKRIEAFDGQIAALKAEVEAARAESEANEARMADAVGRTADRIERLAKGVTAPVSG